MTLIAGFKLGNCAILLGDALLTGPTPAEGPSVKKKPLNLPAHYWHDPFNPPEVEEGSGWEIKALVQKLIIINEHCAIAWAGQEIAARALIKDLQIIASSRNIAITDLEATVKAVAPVNSQGDSEITIIAILLEFGEPIIWSNEKANVSSTFLGEVSIGGCATQSLIDLLHTFDSANTIVPHNGEIELFATSVALHLTTAFLSDEFHTQRTFSSLIAFFGGIYEIVVYSNGKVRKLEEVTYIFLEAHVREDNQIKISTPSLILKQQSKDSSLLIRSLLIRRNDESLDADKPSLDIIREEGYRVEAPGLGKYQTGAREALHLNMHSQFLCTTIAIWKNGEVILTPTFTRTFNSFEDTLKKGIMLIPIFDQLHMQCTPTYWNWIEPLIKESLKNHK
jgi:hypothetical protein